MAQGVSMKSLNSDMQSKLKLSQNVYKLKDRSANMAHDAKNNQVGGGSPWELGPGIKTLKLSMILLIFLYSNDDMKISIFEKRSLNKAIGSFDKFTKEDRIELKSLIKLLPDANYVLSYIRKYQLTKGIVMASIKILKEDIGLNKEDTKMIDEFKKEYNAIEL